MTTAKSYITSFVNLIFPKCCCVCGEVLFDNEPVLCLKCFADLPKTGFHKHNENDVARIFWGRIPFQNATSFIFFTKDSPYRKILYELKYRGQKNIGIEMGRYFGLELEETEFAKVDIIHPVPLHHSKYRKRGYNQSELIATGISEALKVPVFPDLTVRRIGTTTQTKKNRYERWENVKDSFIVTEPCLLKNKHILLVDDVITTGATIEACANAILKISDTTISIASLAYVKLQ